MKYSTNEIEWKLEDLMNDIKSRSEESTEQIEKDALNEILESIDHTHTSLMKYQSIVREKAIKEILTDEEII